MNLDNFKAPKWLIGLAILPFPFVGYAFYTQARYQYAHQESRCPFVEVQKKETALALIREDKRRCIDEVEEHRFVLESNDGNRAHDFEMGRYPLRKNEIEGGMHWRAQIRDGRAEVHMMHRGRGGQEGEVVFRGPPPGEM